MAHSVITSLDLTTILNISQALSREIELDKLLATLLETVLNHARADHGAFLMAHQPEWCIEAMASLEKGTEIKSIPLSHSQRIPQALIHHVQQELKALVINNAITDIHWQKDPYLLKKQPKSLLCTPILQQGKLVAILYLENRKTEGTFTRDLIEFLNFLCTQVAISLENARLYAQAQEKAKALEQSEQRYRYLATATSQIIWIANLAGENTNTIHWMEYTGQSEAEVAGAGWLDAIHPDDLAHTVADWTTAVNTKSLYKTQYRIRGKNGQYRHFDVKGVPLMTEDGEIYEWIGTCTDIHDRKEAELALERKSQELQEALTHVQNAQLQMVQNEKMASLGNLVAGVAHEINNPIGFLNGSLHNAQDYVKDLLAHVRLYAQFYPNSQDEIIDHAEDIDLEFLQDDLPKLLHSMQGAMNRIRSISNSLRTFSRADTDQRVEANIHDGLDSTLLILKYRLKANELRPAIEVVCNYGDLPLVNCFPGQLNQVFMNIIANAIDAFDEQNLGKTFAEIEKHPNRITVKTAIIADHLEVRIGDNGLGMDEAIKSRIFDHLFTTKKVGKGTGLGLAIARQIIIETHGGSLTVDSTYGQGTTFIIRLPVSSQNFSNLPIQPRS